jgi:hypothetical protein
VARDGLPRAESHRHATALKALAQCAGVSLTTARMRLNRAGGDYAGALQLQFELQQEALQLRFELQQKRLRAALEAAGVEFINGEQPGV